MYFCKFSEFSMALRQFLFPSFHIPGKLPLINLHQYKREVPVKVNNRFLSRYKTVHSEMFYLNLGECT